MRHSLAIALLLMICLASCMTQHAVALPKTDVTLTPDWRARGSNISEEFIGFSFETRRLLPDDQGRYYFSPDDTELVSLFKSLGVKSLRIGGNTADRAAVPIPSNKDIDSLYAFADAADVKIIYNLRLKNTSDPTDDVRIVKHIMDHYASRTSCFTIGNEPDFYYDKYSDYLAQFKKFSQAILAAVPDAKFCGPSSAGHQEWAANLARDIPTSQIAFLSLHTYPGGNAQAAGAPAAARAHILSPEMDEGYKKFLDHFASAAAEKNLSFRLEECNSLYNGGAAHISNSFAAAIWAIDFMYFWAGHGAAGVNFHTGTNPDVTSRIPGGYDAFWNSPSGIKLHPISYALKIFDLAAHGQMIPLNATTTAADKLNYSAYAVRNGQQIYITILNRSSVSPLRDLSFMIDAGSYHHADVLPLLAPNNDAGEPEGVTLGSAPIDGDGSWAGKWTSLSSNGRANIFIVNVPATSAAVVRLSQ